MATGFTSRTPIARMLGDEVTNVNEFNRAVMDFASVKSPGRLTAVVRKTTLDILRGVLLRSPVRTGRLRSGWQASIGIPSNASPLAMVQIGETKTKRGRRVAGRAIDRRNLDEAIALLETLEFGQPTWITNNVVYAAVVEYGGYSSASAGEPGSRVTSSGFSRQAPQGMLNVTIVEYTEYLRSKLNVGEAP